MRSARLILFVLSINGAARRTTFADEPPPFGEHSKPTVTFSFSPDGRYLALVEGSPLQNDEPSPQIIKLFDESGHLVSELKPESGRCDALSFSPDATLLASVDPSAEGTVWRLPEGRACGELPACSSRAVFVSNKSLVLLRYDSVMLWDISSGKSEWAKELRAPEGKWNRDPTTARVVSPDGKWLAANGGDRTVKLWDISSGEIKHDLAGHTAKIISLEFAPDSKSLVSTAGGQKSRGELIVWDLEKGEQRCGVEHLQGLNNSIYSACYSADGKLLAWTAGAPQIEICDARTCARKNVIRSRSLAARQLAFSPDGRWLASLDITGSLKLWEVRRLSAPPPAASVGD